ncbi:MAG: Hemin transport system permease protein HmuU [Deltaproteobacteria bacterium ADurb.Bin510]|nr:MAG: Hemin transport system permease protein HmuU [Deltaproteobacteria bacterium ADurb.Bin510]
MSHLNEGCIPLEYSAYVKRKHLFLIALALITLLLVIAAICLGAVNVPLTQIFNVLSGQTVETRYRTIIQGIRLPHALAALLAGAGLAAAGAAMQSILRNPLGSPFTLGLSQAGAFGAAFAVMILGTGTMQSTQVGSITIANPYVTTMAAFIACLGTSFIIIAIARLRGATPEILVLSGVALGSLFSAATMFLQYFADDVQLAAIVFWSFGDVGRAGWREVGLMAMVVIGGMLFFVANRWNYNAIDAGDETAQSLGVNVERVRLAGMTVASLITAFIVSFLGVIGFVGLICPHMVRRLIGDDHRFVLPASCLTGSVLLLAADTLARVMFAPHVLPVAVLTAFLGAPTFIYLLIRGKS